MRIVVAPPVPALLPAYASLVDPVPGLRRACGSAVGWLGPVVRVLADDAGAEAVGRSLLAGAGKETWVEARALAGSPEPDLLVMANGSARRSEKAPGHLDPRAAGYDDWLEQLLRLGDLPGLASLDVDEGEELLATGLRSLSVLARQLTLRGTSVRESVIEHDDDPYGVQYWVVRWQCGS